MERSVIGVTVSSLITLVILVILIGLSNLLPMQNESVKTVVTFMNDHVVTVIIFILFFFLGELFTLFSFPINLPGPIFFAYGGYFMTTFIFKLFYLIEDLINLEVFSQIKFLEEIIALVVFFVILIVGITKIFAKRYRDQNYKPQSEKEIEWSDVGKELKEASYNIAHKLKESSKKEEKKKEKKEKKKEDTFSEKKEEKKKEDTFSEKKEDKEKNLK